LLDLLSDPEDGSSVSSKVSVDIFWTQCAIFQKTLLVIFAYESFGSSVASQQGSPFSCPLSKAHPIFSEARTQDLELRGSEVEVTFLERASSVTAECGEDSVSAP
jgi:hypothetical protein